MIEHEVNYIVCPSCFATNKIAKGRLTDKPKCGKCGYLLFQGKPAKLDDSSFLKFVKNTNIPVVVDFWAVWCGPCKMMAPIFEQAAQTMEPKVIFAKLNTEEAPVIATEYHIRSIPTIAIFENGKLINQRAGAMSLPDLKAWINQSV